MAELPPSRPENRHTTSLGIIARSRLLNALGTIANLATRATLPSPAEIEQVDGMLHAARVSIPLPLKFREIGASIADSPQVIMARLFLSMLLNKGYNMIHRRFLFVDSPSQTEDLYAHSRRRCLDASLEMLTLLRDLEQEMRPSGVLESMRWRVMSLLNHQFLTATMILCAVLYHPEVTYRREGIVRALRSTRDLWMRSNSLALSKDAQKAADIVGTALAHNDRPAPPAPAPAVSPPAVPSGPAAPAPHDTNMGMSIPTPAAPESAFLNQPPAVIAGGAAATYDDYGQPLDPNTAAAFQANPIVANALAENYGRLYQQPQWYGHQDPAYAFTQQPQQSQHQYPDQVQQQLQWPFPQPQQGQGYDPNVVYQGGGQASNWWQSGDPRWSI